ncbi:H-NS family nucleoid-associated regulatory protein [Salipiger mucosus]|uniref:Histone family protein nucleoid-structuring protein H-NS n=1 Tax=Salipiger mucosus DSM 16094 TaxID=1123237 RepID=S9RNU8_9RHOB|nr:H-NS histone family protein [Salipiger mucosus]EPX75639.1 histone family protein nucleoid-structuring protein H-NS [Salipiger mucosus DSM 16094]
MASVNLEELSLDELKQLQKDVSKAIETFEARRKKEARAAAEAVVREMGFSLSEVADAPTSKRSKGVPKYQHPENSELTWTGRGRKPAWFIEAVEAGKSPEDLLIK